MAKRYWTEMAWQAADDCLQIHGDIGLTTDLPVERFRRDQLERSPIKSSPFYGIVLARRH